MNLSLTKDRTPAQRWHDIAYWGLWLVACAVFYQMNVLTPFKEDDLSFCLIEGEWTPMRSFVEFLRSHAFHYMHTNGRTSDIVAGIFCGLLGKPLFNVCNTLAFGLMMHLLSLLATGRRSVMVLAMFLAFFGCCYPVPGETMLWLAGSCNYMWAITVSLGLVYYLLRHRDRRPGPLKCLGLLVCGIVAGSFNEGTTLGFFMGLVLYYAVNRRLLDRTVVVVLAGYMLGILLIALSPGALARATGGYIVVNLGMNELLSSRWFIFYEKAWRFYTPVGALAVGLVALLWKGVKPVKQTPWTYIFFSLVLAMFILGIVHERAYTALVTVAFIILAMGVDYLLQRWWWTRWARLAIVVVGLALFAYTARNAFYALNAYKQYEDKIVAEIRRAPRQAVLRASQFDVYTRFAKSISYDSSGYFPRELILASYYDKDNLQFVPDSVYDRYHSGRLLDGAMVLPLTSDRPEVADTVLGFQGQDYMAIVLKVDTIPHTYQEARYYFAQTTQSLDAEELERRSNYGLTTEYSPMSYYPVEYQSKHLLICPLITDDISRVVISLDGELSQGELTFTR